MKADTVRELLAVLCGADFKKDLIRNIVPSGLSRADAFVQQRFQTLRSRTTL